MGSVISNSSSCGSSEFDDNDHDDDHDNNDDDDDTGPNTKLRRMSSSPLRDTYFERLAKLEATIPLVRQVIEMQRAELHGAILRARPGTKLDIMLRRFELHHLTHWGYDPDEDIFEVGIRNVLKENFKHFF